MVIPQNPDVSTSSFKVRLWIQKLLKNPLVYDKITSWDRTGLPWSRGVKWEESWKVWAMWILGACSRDIGNPISPKSCTSLHPAVLNPWLEWDLWVSHSIYIKTKRSKGLHGLLNLEVLAVSWVPKYTKWPQESHFSFWYPVSSFVY